MARIPPSKAFIVSMSEAMFADFQRGLNPMGIPALNLTRRERARALAYFRKLAARVLTAEYRVDTLRSSMSTITQFMAPAQLRRRAEREYGLTPDEAVDAAYENIQAEAKACLRAVPKARKSADSVDA